jgi:hypothetical protein
LQIDIISELESEGADKRKIVVGLQMSSNTFKLAKKTNNETLNQAVGPGQGNQMNDEGRLKYYEVNIISIMIDHIVLPYFTCVFIKFLPVF